VRDLHGLRWDILFSGRVLTKEESIQLLEELMAANATIDRLKREKRGEPDAR